MRGGGSRELVHRGGVYTNRRDSPSEMWQQSWKFRKGQGKRSDWRDVQRPCGVVGQVSAGLGRAACLGPRRECVLTVRVRGRCRGAPQDRIQTHQRHDVGAGAGEPGPWRNRLCCHSKASDAGARVVSFRVDRTGSQRLQLRVIGRCWMPRRQPIGGQSLHQVTAR